MQKPFRVKHRFIAGQGLYAWQHKDFEDISQALDFAKEHLVEGDEVRIFDRSLKMLGINYVS